MLYEQLFLKLNYIQDNTIMVCKYAVCLYSKYNYSPIS